MYVEKARQHTLKHAMGESLDLNGVNESVAQVVNELTDKDDKKENEHPAKKLKTEHNVLPPQKQVTSTTTTSSNKTSKFNKLAKKKT